MAETLSAIALVTSSAKGNSLVFWWPPSPTLSPRFCRARPSDFSWPSFLDNPWRASHPLSDAAAASSDAYDLSENHWPRPLNPSDEPHPHPTSRNTSPSRPHSFCSRKSTEYDSILGYSSEYLANLLCPHPSTCHQKFELIVDDLVFLGHPVCADDDGTWRFKSENNASGSRGRNSRSSQSPLQYPSTSSSSRDRTSQSTSAWLQTFHLVLILDLPEPSLSGSGNVLRYFDVIYQQIIFVITAVLFQEQVLCNFVERECDVLGTLKESCMSKGESFCKYAAKAIEQSSIAPAMKAVYEATRSSAIAYVTLHDIPLELQFPPHLNQLLYNQDDVDASLSESPDDEGLNSWGPEMSDGWKLPSLTPWRSLLLLCEQQRLEMYLQQSATRLLPQDHPIAESLIKFMKIVNITLSLADIASLLDWDLETQVYPTVCWFVRHRWAKVVDVVHPGLKTIFTLPPKFTQPLPQFVAEFDNRFHHPSVPRLPDILAAISKSENHFFASAVKSRELIPMYHEIVNWMLEHDLLVTLHLRIRLVATLELKTRVRQRRREVLFKRATRSKTVYRPDPQQLSEDLDPEATTSFPWLPLSPRTARRDAKQLSSMEYRRDVSRLVWPDKVDHFHDDDEGGSSVDGGESGWESSEEGLVSTVIEDPARATPLQRRWLSAMSDGKDLYIAKRFALLNQYFDGKMTDDEILHRAEISRKQLREVLHHYHEYVQTFLHPS
ncbi:Nitrogen Permease regulator of amino acid transport activity 3 domain containing protein [Amanita muscaria]